MEYANLCRLGEESLRAAGIEEAALDARLLLEYVCHTDRNMLFAHGDEPVDESSREEYLRLINLRSARTPLQHITHEQEFMGLKFKVSEDVLIPRQDTEILAEEALKRLHDKMAILDMCTGSGCVILSLLKYSNECIGVGVDISPKAIGLARENAHDLSLEATFVESDLFSAIGHERKFDLLTANPPYIKSEDISGLMAEVREHEPRLALDGGLDGLDFYRRIADEAKPYLYRGANVLFEIGWGQGKEVREILDSHGCYKEIEVIKDFAGLDRVVACIFEG